MPDLKSHHISKFSIHFLCHAIGESDSSQSSRLGDHNLSKLVIILFQQKLPDLCTFAWACLPADESHKVVVDGFNDLLFFHVDR